MISDNDNLGIPHSHSNSSDGYCKIIAKLRTLYYKLQERRVQTLTLAEHQHMIQFYPAPNFDALDQSAKSLMDSQSCTNYNIPKLISIAIRQVKRLLAQLQSDGNDDSKPSGDLVQAEEILMSIEADLSSYSSITALKSIHAKKTDQECITDATSECSDSSNGQEDDNKEPSINHQDEKEDGQSKCINILANETIHVLVKSTRKRKKPQKFIEEQEEIRVWGRSTNKEFELGCIKYGWGDWDKIQALITGKSRKDCEQYAAMLMSKHPEVKRRLDMEHKREETSRKRSDKQTKMVEKVKKAWGSRPRKAINWEIHILKRQIACGGCAACSREDCGECINCLDKPKFGGAGRSKQRCVKRRCCNMRRVAMRRVTINKKKVRITCDAVKEVEDSACSFADAIIEGTKVRITLDAVKTVETYTSSLLETIIEEESIDPSTLKVGSRVLVDSKGTTFNATICKRREKLGVNEVLIHYDGQKKTTLHWVSVNLVTYILPQSNLDKSKKKRKRNATKSFSIVRGDSPINMVSSIIDRDMTTDSIRRRTAPKRFVARPSKSGVGVEDGDKDYLAADNTLKPPINKKRVDNSVGQYKERKPSSTATIVSLDNDEVPLEHVSMVKKGKGGKPLCKAKGCQKYIQGRHGLCATHYNASSGYQLKEKSMDTRSCDGKNERHSIRKRSAPEMFEARPAKYRAVEDGKVARERKERTRSLQLEEDPSVLHAELEETSWQCHLCNNSNHCSKSRCTSCLGWKGGSHLKKWYIASADETPRGIASKLHLNLALLIRANKKHHPTLLEHSKLKKGTYIQISHFPNVKVVRVRVTQGGMPVSAPSKPDNALKNNTCVYSKDQIKLLVYT